MTECGVPFLAVSGACDPGVTCMDDQALFRPVADRASTSGTIRCHPAVLASSTVPGWLDFRLTLYARCRRAPRDHAPNLAVRDFYSCHVEAPVLGHGDWDHQKETPATTGQDHRCTRSVLWRHRENVALRFHVAAPFLVAGAVHFRVPDWYGGELFLMVRHWPARANAGSGWLRGSAACTWPPFDPVGARVHAAGSDLDDTAI